MILLDTNVLSELAKPQPDPRVVSWARHSAAALAVPTIAVAEMAYGSRSSWKDAGARTCWQRCSAW